MVRSEIVVDCSYHGLNPVQFGAESCAPGHSYGPAVRTHWLLHYVTAGKGRFLRDGAEYTVGPGEMFVIPPYLETYYEADRERPWEYVWIGFTADGELPDFFANSVISCPEVGAVFDEMRLCREYESGRSAYLSACLWKVVGILLETGKEKSDYIDKALSCIHSEYSNGITVQQIADRLNLDRSYFSTLFSKRVGMPPRDYLRSYRLNKAAELMAVHGEKPTTAAASVGYDDLFHFSKSFKRHFGLSPRAYAKKFRS